MESVRLSICIPSKNFGDFIGQTLKGIIEQAEKGLEIVVVDGGSTDNTIGVLNEIAEGFPALRFVCQKEALGVDRDLATAVELARGGYCWLMSADDVVKPGAIKRVLNEIESGCDSYLVNRTDCTRDLIPVRDRRWLDSSIGDRRFDFRNKEEILQYFQASRSIGALFSYVSSIIVRREAWEQAKHSERARGTNYEHVYRIFSFLLAAGSHQYIEESLVSCRGQNDSFMSDSDRGLARRFVIDIDGYHRIGNLLFADPELRKAFLAVMRQEHHWTTWIRLAVRVPESSVWEGIRAKLIDFGYSPWQLGLVDVLRRVENLTQIFQFVRRLRKAIRMRT
jgi:abequosyltransferase